mgnify:FL=1|tara:strand:+ start:315 stop:560 length:246 start_codon:yes stop_codon:yes gene_type:complete
MPRVKELPLHHIDNYMFDRYLAVQYEGSYNMYSQEAREMAELTRDEHFTIIKNYAKLIELFPQVYEHYAGRDSLHDYDIED